MSALLVLKQTATAVVPTRATKDSAGYDLSADEAFFLLPGERRLASTGIAVRIPIGHYGQIASRSGLAVKKSVEAFSGVIDSDYNGEVKVLLKNLGSEVQHFAAGDRIAQLILVKITTPEVILLESLPETERGGSGFGSTGH